MAGVYLDTAWHRTIGRDSFFMLPHLFIYGGGLGILGACLAAIARATRGHEDEFGGPILQAGRWRFPFGFTGAALGILVIVVAAPVDAWWHWMWGKDVLMWSPSHLQLHLGAGITAVGLLFAIAAQEGRGWLKRKGLWQAAMLAVFVDLVHRGHFVLAHYTMIPQTRTPDFYPFLGALLLPVSLVAAARALGPWAPTVASAAFLGVAALHDGLLTLIGFDRYTLTPLVVVPAAGLTLLYLAVGRRREYPWVALGSGLAFALVFTGMEAVWMAKAVGRPWPLDRALAGLPRSLVAGALSGYVGWVLGGFLRAVAAPGGVRAVFGPASRARRVAVAALGLAVIGLVSTYQPQRFGPPMTVEELALTPIGAFRYQEAVFWEVLLQDGWARSHAVQARSEGIIDGFPLPVGPAWCGPGQERLSFGLTINGTPADLSRYPLVRLPNGDGTVCAWVGVASRHQRASRNRFRYTIDYPGADGAVGGRVVVDMDVVFKDP